MDKKSVLALAACTVLATCANAQDEKDKKIEMLIERLEKVEAELAKFRHYTDTQIDELHIRADENELNAALSKIKFGLEFETSAHSFNGKLTSPTTGVTSDVDSSNKWTNVLMLNMDADINENTRFTGRLSMAKAWADSTNQIPTDTTAGRSIGGGSSLFVERAYVDYKFSDSFIATIGRQPGTDGPGANLKNNAKRQSTYPALLFNATGDALVLTYKPNIESIQQSAFRLGYAKAFQWDSGTTSDSIVGEELLDDAEVFLAVAEGKLDLGSMGDNLLMLSGVMAPDFNIPVSAPIDNLTVGDLTLANLYFENNNAFGSNFNWFTSLGYSKGSDAVDNSSAINTAIYDYAYANSLATTGNPGTAAAVAVGAVAANGAKTIAATTLNEESGWAVHLGGRYDFTKEWKVGYEFFHGSKYWYSFTSASASDPINILETRGDAHTLYAIYQMDLNQFLRLSYSKLDYDYSGSGQPVGPVSKSDDQVDHWSLTYNVKF